MEHGSPKWSSGTVVLLGPQTRVQQELVSSCTSVVILRFHLYTMHHSRTSGVVPLLMTVSLVAAVIGGQGPSSPNHDSGEASHQFLRTRRAPDPSLGVVLDASVPTGVRLVPYASSRGDLVAWAGYTDTIHEDGWSYLS